MMKEKLSVLLFLTSFVPATCQETASFEELPLKPNTAWNGADGSGKFVSGGFTFHNDYNKDWGSWSGFAYSNQKDSITPDWTNQYSAVTGEGVFSSSNYGVGYDYGNVRVKLDKADTVTGIYVTNSTYTYKTLRNGNAFTKKFGGVSGNDPDYFRLKISGLTEKNDTAGSVFFYLADFRPADPLADYIIRKWTWVDLSVLGKITEIRFSLESTDTGAWGMNTPGYFCIDDLNHRDMAPVVRRPVRDIIWEPGDNAQITIPLDSVFLDPDNPESKGRLSIASVSGDDVAEISLTGESSSPLKSPDVISILIRKGAAGLQKIAILYTSNGKSVADTFSVRVHSTSGMVTTRSAKIRIFPNPFRGSFSIEPIEPESEIFVYNMKGDLIFRSGILSRSREKITMPDDIPSGIFVIAVKRPGDLQYITVIKH